MDLQKTLTNAGRRLAPGLAAVYDTFRGAQDQRNSARADGYYKGKTSISVPDLYNKGLQNQIDAINRDTSRWNEDYAYYNDLVNKGLADSSEAAYRNEAYTAIQNNNQKVRELEGKKLANNETLFDMAANALPGSPLKKVDAQATIDNLINGAIAIARYEEIKQGSDKYYELPKEDIDTFNEYIKTLKDLGVSKDDVSAEYYRRYPTKEQEAWDEFGKMMNDWVYNKLGTIDGSARYGGNTEGKVTDSQLKKGIAKALSRMVSDGEVTANLTRTQQLIDLYKKLK